MRGPTLSHLRRRGATLYFRRRIPQDLLARFATAEIIRSLGRASAGEARRLAAQYLLRTETLFMRVRQDPRLTREAAASLAAAVLDEHIDLIETFTAAVPRDTPLAGLQEPAHVAARLRGASACAATMLDRNAIDSLSTAIRGRIDAEGEPPEVIEAVTRRAARAILATYPAAITDHVKALDRLGRNREAQPIAITEAEYPVTQQELSALLAMPAGARAPDWLLQRLASDSSVVPSSPDETNDPTGRVDGASLRVSADPLDGAQTLAAENAKTADGAPAPLISALWPDFVAHKISTKAWKKNAGPDAGTTLKLWVDLVGDRPIDVFGSDHIGIFRDNFQCLPSDYYHNKKYRDVYEREGARAVIKMCQGQTLERTSAKTANKRVGHLAEFFAYAAEPKKILLEDAKTICKGHFIRIPKSGRSERRRRDEQRIFLPAEQKSLFDAAKFMGTRSASGWKDRGSLVFRDERYWLTIIGALIGCRREEPVLLRVRHVRNDFGIWYFDWYAEELEQSLKDCGSPRQTPLPQALLDIGFLEARVHGRPADDLLFPEAVSHSVAARMAEPFGKWFLHFRRHCGVDDDRLDYHAWRGTVVTELVDVGVSREIAEEIVGHESDARRSMFDVYNKRDRLGVLKDALDKRSAPFNVQKLIGSVRISDGIDRSAAWPDLSDPRIVPRPRRTKTQRS